MHSTSRVTALLREAASLEKIRLILSIQSRMQTRDDA